MARLKRFEGHRFVGARDTMVVYDCDDAEQCAEIESRVEAEALVQRNLIQSFAPDLLSEARNRGFTPRS